MDEYGLGELGQTEKEKKHMMSLLGKIKKEIQRNKFTPQKRLSEFKQKQKFPKKKKCERTRMN